jgi:hypothetical protein
MARRMICVLAIALLAGCGIVQQPAGVSGDAVLSDPMGHPADAMSATDGSITGNLGSFLDGK